VWGKEKKENRKNLEKKDFRILAGEKKNLGGGFFGRRGDFPV